MGMPIIVTAPPPVWELELIAPWMNANQTEQDVRQAAVTPYSKNSGVADPNVNPASSGGTGSHADFAIVDGVAIVENWTTGANTVKAWAHPAWFPPLGGTYLGPTLGRYRYAWIRSVMRYGSNDVAYNDDDGPGFHLFAYGGSGTLGVNNAGPGSTNPRSLAGIVPVTGAGQGVRAATFDTAGAVLDASATVEVGDDFFTADFLVTAAGVGRAASLEIQINGTSVGVWDFGTASLLAPADFTDCFALGFGYWAMNISGNTRTYGWQGWHLRCGAQDINGTPIPG